MLTSPQFHAGMAERANRSIKERLYRYFTERGTYKWIEVVQDIVKGINYSLNSSIGMRPADVNFGNAEELRQKLYNEAKKILKMNPKFKVGDRVTRQIHSGFVYHENYNSTPNGKLDSLLLYILILGLRLVLLNNNLSKLNGKQEIRLYSDNLWTDLSRIYLYLELSIEKPGATDKWVAIEDTDVKVSTIQGIGQTFVQQLKVTVGNTEVYDSGNLYPFKAYITNELSFPVNAKKNFLGSTRYYHTERHNDETDDGFKERCKVFKGGNSAQFLSRLDFDLGNQELYLLNNLDLLFTIYKAKDAFLLQTLKANDDTKYRLTVHDVKIYAKMIEVQPSLNMNLYKTLEKQPATYAVRKTEIKSSYISSGRYEFEYNVFSSTIPRRVTIALVSNSAFNGDYKLTPFKFDPFDLREISVHAGGMVYPVVPHKLNFSKNYYVRAFVEMYEALGMANSERSFDVSMDQFKNGWAFFVIPLNSTLDDSCGFELLRSGTTSIRATFDSPIPKGGVEMIVLGEFDQMIMIDYNRHIVSDSKLGWLKSHGHLTPSEAETQNDVMLEKTDNELSLEYDNIDNDDSCWRSILKATHSYSSFILIKQKRKMSPSENSDRPFQPPGNVQPVQQPHQQPDADAELQAQIEDAEEDLLLNWWREDPTIICFLFGNRRAPAIEAALLQRAEHEAEIFRQYAENQQQQ
ncbi:hypothetical protein niasHT_034189 [Heterodera trifolii]|uniref:Integrase catalytic domain-containing protein n=1 Tax=Heterodera trifolii TaxID=157864 RepID=A0ABD2J5D9_9BILA